MPEDKRDNNRGDGNGQNGQGGRRSGRRRFWRGPRPQEEREASGDPAGEREGERRQGPGRGRGPMSGREPVLPREPAAPRPEPPTCPLCGKPIFDLSTALSSDREAGLPAHFDCVAERIVQAEALGPTERLVYIGSGSFGVIEYRDKSETAFVVKRRIQWEKEGEKKDWRKGLSSRITKI